MLGYRSRDFSGGTPRIDVDTSRPMQFHDLKLIVVLSLFMSGSHNAGSPKSKTFMSFTCTLWPKNFKSVATHNMTNFVFSGLAHVKVGLINCTNLDLSSMKRLRISLNAPWRCHATVTDPRPPKNEGFRDGTHRIAESFFLLRKKSEDIAVVVYKYASWKAKSFQLMGKPRPAQK